MKWLWLTDAEGATILKPSSHFLTALEVWKQNYAEAFLGTHCQAPPGRRQTRQPPASLPLCHELILGLFVLGFTCNQKNKLRWSFLDIFLDYFPLKVGSF